MIIEEMKILSYEEIRNLYKKYLNSQDIAKNTVNTAYADTFYFWRNGGKDLFWDTVTSSDFEKSDKSELITALTENSTGNINVSMNGYLSHLRRFRLFLASDDIVPQITQMQGPSEKRPYSRKKRIDIDVPRPSVEQVEFYHERWDDLENYHLQEDALNKLFFELCPQNVDITDVLLKTATLNDFYSTNIFSIYPGAKHICSLNIDARLKDADAALVGDILHVTINDTEKNFHSFATKYCNHHNPLNFPIYDSYVDVVLRYFRNCDDFSNF